MKRFLCILFVLTFTNLVNAQVSLPADSVNSVNAVLFISNPTPNPAAAYINFNYDLAPGTEAAIKIYNPLGNLVRSVPLNSSSKNAFIDVSALDEGFYFYSIIANGKAINTKRLVISR